MTEIAKLFFEGEFQAVRLPKTCRFDGNEVLVNRIGNMVILMPADDPWSAMMSSLNMFTDDFMKEGIEDLPL